MVWYYKRKTKQELHKSLNLCSKEEEKLEEQKTVIIFHIFIQGDNRKCSNYFGVTLYIQHLKFINATFSIFLQCRLQRILEDQFINVQSGFSIICGLYIYIKLDLIFNVHK